MITIANSLRGNHIRHVGVGLYKGVSLSLVLHCILYEFDSLLCFICDSVLCSDMVRTASE